MNNIIHIPNMETLDLWSELYSLENHLQFVEQQIEFLAEQEQLRVRAAIHAGRYTPEDPDYHIEYQHLYHLQDIVLPRIFRNSFLVTLWSIYESSIYDLADLFRDHLLSNVAIERRLSLKDLAGGFLNKAQAYFEKVLNRRLVTSGTEWSKIKMLYELRNAIAHAAGRMDAVAPTKQKKLIAWSKQNFGIEARSSYLIVTSQFARDMHDVIRNELEHLIRDYEQLQRKNSSA